jgi:hypothetical protein
MFLRKPSDTLYSFENFGYIIPRDSKIKLVFLNNGKRSSFGFKEATTCLLQCSPK